MEKSVILNAENFRDSVIETTAKKISANPDKFYLLSTYFDAELCSVIDKLSKAVSDNSALTCIRFAYDVNFELATELRTGNEESGVSVHGLAELLDKLEFDENLMLSRDDYHVVIDDTNVPAEQADRAVAQLFQQTVFLNLNLDIKKKSEIKKALIKERFRAGYEQLRAEIDRQKNYLANALAYSNLTENGKARVAGMISAFDKAIEETDKARKRPLRIAAMGTKKAGKSVVINSLLKRDYAPTSSELPTPNVIKYIPAEPNSELILDYDGRRRTFDSAESLSKFIGNEFEEAQQHTGKGSELGDMVIYYPSSDLNGYEVWDTPGPNFAGAGAEHQKIAEECIKAADVCIFVMNYSNHLTNDEVKFLSQIRQTFAENNKFYSLFITVNRIDERYAAEVEKSVNRILDYISGRLEALDYKNIVIFGTSALQSFYLDKVLGILKADGVEIDEDNPLGDAIRRAKRKHRELMTPLRFVEDALKNLEDFHGIDEPDVKLLENFSGVPQLWRHVKYIGEQKVDTEIVDSVLSRCEMQFAAVRNALLVTGLQDLSKKDKERLADLEQEIITLSNAVARAMSEVDAITSNDGELKIAKADISEEARSIKRAAIRSAKDRSSNIIRNSTLTDGDVEEIQRGNSNSNIDRLFQSLDNLIIQLNKDSEDRLVKLIAVEGSNFSRKVEDAVQNAQQKIIDETERVKNSVPSNTAAGDMMRAFTLPEFPVSLNKLSSSFSGLQSGISYSELRGIAKNSIRIDRETRTRTETHRRKSRGIWEGLRSFFGKKYYEDVDVSYTVDIARADAARFKENIKRLLMDSVIGEIEDANDIMEDDVKQKITEVYEDVKAQCAEIGANYQEIFDSFRADIEAAKDETGAHQKAIEHDIVVLVDIEKNIQPFFELWQRIIHGEG